MSIVRLRWCARASILTLGLVAAWPSSAAAQSAVRVAGTVVDAVDETALRGALVQLEATDQVTVSGDDGSFELIGVPAGRYVLHVSLVGYGLVRRTVDVADGLAPLLVRLVPGTGTYEEEVRVEGRAAASTEPAVPAQITFGPAEMQNLKGVLADDPLRAVQVAPGVATGDDFRAEFSIRGSDPRNIGLSLDGVPNVLFLHEDQGAGDTASVALINGDLVEEVSILSGSYPQRFGDRTGAQVDFITRTGSRARTQVRAAVSGSNASLVGEGPIGARGSWLAGFRQSYLGWLVRRIDPEATGTANFTDGQANLVFDVSARHQLRVNLVAGALRREENDDTPSINSDEKGASDVGIANLSWWWQASDRLFLVQRVFWSGDSFRDVNFLGDELSYGSLRNLGYRGDLGWDPADGYRFEAGWNVTDQSGAARISDYDRRTGAIAYRLETEASAAAEGGYAQLRWSPSARFSINAGGRLDRWEIIDATAASPWVQARWAVTGGLTLKAASGWYRQSPDLERGAGPRGNRGLVPERAWHVDLGVEGALFNRARWQLNGYNRDESDITRLPGSETRLLDGELVRDDGASVWRNVVVGYSRGIEVTVRRDRAEGFSGWVGYALTYTRYHDLSTGEAYWGDFDQRHTFNVWGKYRFTNRLEVSSKLRIGSNFPLPGYYRKGGAADGIGGVDPQDRYFVAGERNVARLPLYARLDVRGNYAFNFERSRLTLFIEVINLLNRGNYGPGDPGFINPITFRVNDLTEELFPILPSAGILWEF